MFWGNGKKGQLYRDKEAASESWQAPFPSPEVVSVERGGGVSRESQVTREKVNRISE